ncbi:hypothetical protein, partial [Streptomyces coeruleorubidus]|uniref:hypothetical protein n=1 Tax=Streptomyces coeruleorubidus TaxID=116188 RepID=UPI0036ACAC20
MTSLRGVPRPRPASRPAIRDRARRPAPRARRDWRPAPSPVTGLAICARLAFCAPRGDPRPARRS